MDDAADDEFSIEAIEKLISDAERTVSSVRNSLRAREPSPVRRPIQVFEVIDNSLEESQQEPVERQNSASGSANASGNSNSENHMGINTSVMNEASASVDAPQETSQPATENSGNSNSFDDEVILVSETKNTNPVTIDLCSPDVGNAPRPEGRRRRRRRAGSPNEAPPPQRAVTEQSHPNLKCVICMEDMRSRVPTSTICGHVFCNQCITTTIKVSKRCPICRKPLNLRSIHPLYLFN